VGRHRFRKNLWRIDTLLPPMLHEITLCPWLHPGTSRKRRQTRDRLRPPFGRGGVRDGSWSPVLSIAHFVASHADAASLVGQGRRVIAVVGALRLAALHQFQLR
jgi:hypothetical protein